MLNSIKKFFSDVFDIIVEIRTMQAEAELKRFKVKPVRCTK